jgi:MFS family permease
VGIALISLAEKALINHGLGADGARRLASTLLTAYACGYMLSFLALAWWGGWILHPWRLWWCQGGLLLGTAGLLVMACTGGTGMPAMAMVGLLIGTGYGSAYTASLYYSLRLPVGAARAAGWHEMSIGLGNIMGPLLAGLVMQHGRDDLIGLGIYVVVAAVLSLGVQAALIPGAMKRV